MLQRQQMHILYICKPKHRPTDLPVTAVLSDVRVAGIDHCAISELELVRRTGVAI